MDSLTSRTADEGAAREPKDTGFCALTPGEVAKIADMFRIEPVINSEEYPGKGNINFHTYAVHCTAGHEYLLQCINGAVFKKPERVMKSMVAWIAAQVEALEAATPRGGEEWEPITLVPSESGPLWVDLPDETGKSVWRLMRLIPEVDCWKSLDDAGPEKTRNIASEMGIGLALGADFARLVDLDGLSTSLPGYRDTKGYYQQLHSVLAGSQTEEEAAPFVTEDPEVRESTEALHRLAIPADEARRRREDPELAPFIELALRWEERAKSLQEGVKSGVLSRTAIHGDTKIENFLFCRHTGKVKSLVDLDTIMPYTWLADWGDMVRSLVNVAGEKETDLTKIQVNKEVFRWTAEGFLATTRHTTRAERDMMVTAPQAIALELGVRFLADYLRGDSYFMLSEKDPRNLNKTRAMVQLTLFKRMLDEEKWAMAALASSEPVGL
jgi:hypothetical protein